jgi:hypothetical protein
MASTDDTQEHVDPTAEVWEREEKAAAERAKEEAREAKEATKPPAHSTTKDTGSTKS